MINFDYLEKSLGIVSPAYFVYDFLRKMFPLLYSINWPNFIVWLPLLLEILDNICVLQLFVNQLIYHVINIEINPIFLIKSFFYMIK